MMRPIDWEKIRYFSKSEWVQFPERVSKELVFTMDEVRGTAGCRISILECGASEGHADYSYHYISLAVDFYFESGNLSWMEQFIILSSFPNFGAIGFYPYDGPFWHVDLRNSSPKILWYRDSEENYRYGFRNFKIGLEKGG